MGHFSEAQSVKKLRFTTQALILSMALNVGLIASLIVFMMKSEAVAPLPEQEVVQTTSLTNEAHLRLFSKLSFSELLFALNDYEPVEQGYCKRDLALGVLVSDHYLDLGKALGGIPLTERRVSYAIVAGKEKKEVKLFPALTDYHFKAIQRFARTEKWPMSSEGLFKKIVESHYPRDSSLLEAFSLTPQYQVVAALFAKSDTPLKRELIVELLSQGSWEILQDPPKEKGEFLARYLDGGSPLAAKLLALTEREYAIKKLTDEQLTQLLSLLDSKSPHARTFAKIALAAPRSDLVWKKASKILGTPQVSHPLLQQERTYIVEPGDSLWKIARKFQTSVQILIELNALSSEWIVPGKTLKIPSEQGQGRRDEKGDT